MSVFASTMAWGITSVAKALTGARSIWSGCAPQAQQRIYFANHSSHSDFVLLWASLPPYLRSRTRPVAGADYWLSGKVRPFIINEVFHGVLVERGTHAVVQESAAPVPALAVDAAGTTGESVASDVLEPLKQALREGDSLILFPEGTRNMGDGLLPFKSGIYHLAQAFPQVDLVPVWLGNLNRVMPKGKLIPLPLLCTVNFGVPTKLQPQEDKSAFLARLRQVLWQLGASQEGQ